MGKYDSLHRKSVKKSRKLVLLTLFFIGVLSVCFVVMAALGAFGRSEKKNTSSATVSVKENSSETSSNMTQSETSTSSDISSVYSSKTVSSKVPVSSAKASSVASIVTSEQPAFIPGGDWRLIIANKKHPLPSTFTVNTAYVSGNYRLDARIADAYKSMMAAAKSAGAPLTIISGFRTFKGQQSLFNNKVNQFISKGYSSERAKQLAAEVVAPPGTSEHLTGLAVDLVSPDWYSYNSDLNSDFENTKQFKWLYNNCAQYGFCLRYPKDKTSVTGYSYEPWHYRYVGVEAAKKIMSQKICLEEYAASL